MAKKLPKKLWIAEQEKKTVDGEKLQVVEVSLSEFKGFTRIIWK